MTRQIQGDKWVREQFVSLLKKGVLEYGPKRRSTLSCKRSRCGGWVISMMDYEGSVITVSLHSTCSPISGIGIRILKINIFREGVLYTYIILVMTDPKLNSGSMCSVVKDLQQRY